MMTINNLNFDDSEKSCECETTTVLGVNCLSFDNDQIVIAVTVDKVILNSFIQVELLNSNNEIIQNYQNFANLNQNIQNVNIDISNLTNVNGLNVRIKTQCSDGEYYCVRLKNDSDSDSDQDSNSVDSFQLFDKNSWENVVPQPYLGYLNQAADRWSQFIQYNSNYYQQIQMIIQDESDSDIDFPEEWNNSWNGLRLNSSVDFNLYNSNDSAVASCGIYYFIPFTTGVQMYPLSFVLNINDYYANSFTSEDWINILTHELGHALGIGIFWRSELVNFGAVPPIDNFLSGVAYNNSQSGYNNITNDIFNKVPLESVGGSGTVSSHWENDFRPSSAPGADGKNYPGLQNELMIGAVNPVSNGGMIISELSIKTLVDFGFEEVNPGSSEGVPNLNNAQSANIQNSLIKLNCNCSNHTQMKPLGSLPLLDSFETLNTDSDSNIDQQCDTFCIPKSEYDPDIHNILSEHDTLEDCQLHCQCLDSDSDSNSETLPPPASPICCLVPDQIVFPRPWLGYGKTTCFDNPGDLIVSRDTSDSNSDSECLENSLNDNTWTGTITLECAGEDEACPDVCSFDAEITITCNGNTLNGSLTAGGVTGTVTGLGDIIIEGEPPNQILKVRSIRLEYEDIPETDCGSDEYDPNCFCPIAFPCLPPPEEPPIIVIGPPKQPIININANNINIIENAINNFSNIEENNCDIANCNGEGEIEIDVELLSDADNPLSIVGNKIEVSASEGELITISRNKYLLKIQTNARAGETITIDIFASSPSLYVSASKQVTIDILPCCDDSDSYDFNNIVTTIP
jgi:hypothetical protein